MTGRRFVITEVSLRDGLQELDGFVPTAEKAECVRRFSSAGLAEIEVTSFVRPDRVPQLADAAALSGLVDPVAHPGYSALVLNGKGLERALAAGYRAVALAVSASEAHSNENLGRSIHEATGAARAMVASAKAAGVRVRAGISMAFGCPVEGEVPVGRVEALVRALADEGADEISLADTVGLATPADVLERVAAAAAVTGRAPALHLHDRPGGILDNVAAAVDAGVTHFDCSLTGIGGCPFSPVAVGNLATETLVEALGPEATGLDPAAIAEAAAFFARVIARAEPISAERA